MDKPPRYGRAVHAESRGALAPSNHICRGHHLDGFRHFSEKFRTFTDVRFSWHSGIEKITDSRTVWEKSKAFAIE
jgi:hypothetical protein